MAKKIKNPWPTKKVMEQIYIKHFWGGKDFDFYSGTGSHNPKIITPYIKSLTSFFNSHNKTLTVCDLGCGDFNIGKHLATFTKKYIAIDIVESLIERNKKLFQDNNLEFMCLDISKDKLPKVDCVILRQVLQHLSNTEITQIIKKISHYKYLIITEHLPLGDFIANKNIISGQGIRLKLNSGVNLLENPFKLKVKQTIILNECVLENNKGQIVTKLHKLF